MPFCFGFYIFTMQPTGNGIVDEDILCLQQFVNSFSMMIASLMRIDEGVTSAMLDNNIKIFLSSLHLCEKELGQKIPEYTGIFDKGNFLSLLVSR
jgi:hypothetical protein